MGFDSRVKHQQVVPPCAQDVPREQKPWGAGLFIWQLKASKWLTFLRHVPIRPIAWDREYIKHTVPFAVS